MEPLLLIGYTAVFVGLIAYVVHLRMRLRRVEDRLEGIEERD